VRVARIGPEGRLGERRHSWQVAAVDRLDIAAKAALAQRKAQEILGCLNVLPVLKSEHTEYGRIDVKRLAIRAERPLDCGGVVVVVLRPVAPEGGHD